MDLHRLPLCDTPDRLAARLYLALRVECACCTFYRGVVFVGLPIGFAIGLAMGVLAC